ncbi:MAG: hypothetical protein HDKAJFGB_02326 [Anaerolineae bacterium]|nr:hypothetical protein [Anaerolineae bacterium]
MPTRNKRPITFASGALLLGIVTAAVVFSLKQKSVESDELSQESTRSENAHGQSTKTLPPPDIQVPPEPTYNVDVQTARAQSNANPRTPPPAIDPGIPLSQQWDKFLKKNPPREELAAFLQQLKTPEMLDLMVHVSLADSELASAMFSYEVIPILKQRWSGGGQRWEDDAPYDRLLALASDTENPPLFRMVMVDVLGTGSREATDHNIRRRMADGLAAIGQRVNDAESVRVYAINKLGIISPTDQASPHVGLLRSFVVDQTERGSVRAASITALSRIGDEVAVPLIQDICDQYQPNANPEVARAAVVALGDFARSHRAPALDHIQNVLSKTEDRDVHASALHAVSLLDDAQFAKSLPEILETSKRFEGDAHTRNSLTAVLWAHPDAVMAALNSDDEAAISAAIRAAAIVPLPPARARLEQLLQTRPTAEQKAIRAALEKTNDTEAYEMILVQNAKAQEEH